MGVRGGLWGMGWAGGGLVTKAVLYYTLRFVDSTVLIGGEGILCHLLHRLVVKIK